MATSDRVILGTVDVAAVGARVLLSLEPPSGWTISLLVLNAAVPEEWQGELAAAVLELLTRAGQQQQQQQQLLQDGEEETSTENDGATAAAAAAVAADGGREREVTMVAAMLLQQQQQPKAAAAAAATATALSHLRVRDGMIASLLHVLSVSGTAACCLLTQGHKPPAATTLDLPVSVQACDTIGTALAAAFGLQYDAQKCRTVRALYKWFVPEKSAGSDVMYL
ncbi:hypothetical protein VOLCADRAFT_90409 [Volvox carteri f. nagariensis]|uniref:Uncharacterized protein n=1 Tax=Volvox carteri f. nagariensis TaxID=3068 RepID=D8TUA6_VOLCA|nr:uncharacterized protein VOLCADRAFT_90409 [Volvox carteri f. nagariensis]EFJ49111.1 hypothetical protein VOLCADRAFT_90409 [Volvox carteri f. nagariensis]|eukprot:XP_002950008.1 hypothetical protein VOLCADRAFT_90409 [Volvox carteri f. nagariensis]